MIGVHPKEAGSPLPRPSMPLPGCLGGKEGSRALEREQQKAAEGGTKEGPVPDRESSAGTAPRSVSVRADYVRSLAVRIYIYY